MGKSTWKMPIRWWRCFDGYWSLFSKLWPMNIWWSFKEKSSPSAPLTSLWTQKHKMEIMWSRIPLNTAMYHLHWLELTKMDSPTLYISIWPPKMPFTESFHWKEESKQKCHFVQKPQRKKHTAPFSLEWEPWNASSRPWNKFSFYFFFFVVL